MSTVEIKGHDVQVILKDNESYIVLSDALKAIGRRLTLDEVQEHCTITAFKKSEIKKQCAERVRTQDEESLTVVIGHELADLLIDKRLMSEKGFMNLLSGMSGCVPIGQYYEFR